jgi:hypothetical protein
MAGIDEHFAVGHSCILSATATAHGGPKSLAHVRRPLSRFERDGAIVKGGSDSGVFRTLCAKACSAFNAKPNSRNAAKHQPSKPGKAELRKTELIGDLSMKLVRSRFKLARVALLKRRPGAAKVSRLSPAKAALFSLNKRLFITPQPESSAHLSKQGC